MAFTIKQIKALLSDYGVPAESLDKAAEDICGRHAADMDAIREERDGYKADAQKLTGLQAELEEAQKAAKTAAGYQKRYESEHDAFEKFKSDTEAERILSAKKTAYREILKDAGITNDKNVEKVLKYTSFGDLELVDGKFSNAADLLKSVKEEWPELITTQGQQGAKVGNPPAHNGGSAFAAMNLAEKMQYANTHPGDREVAEWMKNPNPPAKEKE